MKLLLLCIAVALLAAEVELKTGKKRRNRVADAFNNAGIVPEIIDTAPTDLLKASFGDIEINLGNDIFPGDAIVLPTFVYNFEPGCLYTFMIFDKDVPSAANPIWRNYLMGMWVNLSTATLAVQNEIALYAPPSPIPGTGRHTYILLLYKQSYTISNATNPELNRLQRQRLLFCPEDFSDKYCLGEPVAGNFFTAIFPVRAS